MSNADAELAMVRTRIRLLLTNERMKPQTLASYIFFATIAMKLKLIIDDRVGTAAVDGRRLIVSPEFIKDMTPKQLLGILIHEVLHCVFQHFARRHNRYVSLWNIAADLAINDILTDAGFELPGAACFPGVMPFEDYPKALTAEEYYDRMRRDIDSGKIKVHFIHLPDDWQTNKDPGLCDPFGCGGVMDAGNPTEQAEAAAEMKGLVAQATQAAKLRGKLPGQLARAVDEVLEPSVDWRSVLANFVRAVSHSDYAWGPFNRRFVHGGVYLPSLHSPDIGEVGLAIDTSGSISPKDIQRFLSECQGVLEAYDCKAHLIAHDCVVHNTAEWQRSDGPLTGFKPEGGGGTSHVPVFEWIEEKGLNLSCLVCYTDLYTEFPKQAPDYPVLWAVPAGLPHMDDHHPFGEVVKVTADH
jgi:predicted metal-dependent peptidase